MRVGFDATSLTHQGKGVARFQREFLQAADEYALIEELDVFVPPEPDEEALPQRSSWRYHRVRNAPMVVWEQIRRPALARRLGLDAVISASERAALWGPPEIVYVFEHPKHRTRRSREVGISPRQRLVDASTLALFAIARRRATVVAASQATARDIGADAVVYSGVSTEFTPGTGDRTFFLHLASDDPRDNSEVVIDAYAAYGRGAPPLIVAGPIRNRLAALRERAQHAGVAVEWRGFQQGKKLVDLYRGAIAYVDPSLYEGFGLQAAEALACGTPVISSNRMSLPEVVGDAGILLEPNDVEGFAHAMRKVAEDTTFAAALSRDALVQASRFTWEATVKGLLDACADALARRRE